MTVVAASAPARTIARGAFRSEGWIAVAAALVAAVIASLALAAPIDPFDGGISSSAATFTLHGLLPYRDYWLLYGPLGGWLLAVPVAVFGPSVELIRVAGLLLVGAHAYFGCRIALHWTRPGAAIILAICAGILAPAFTGVEFGAWSLGLVFALAAFHLRIDGRAPIVVGILVGLTFLSRIDLGGYALIACLVLPVRVPLLLGFAAAALPFVGFAVITTPGAALIQQLLWFPLVGQRQFRALPDLAATMTPASAVILAIPLAVVPRLAILASFLWTFRARADREALALTVFAALCQLQALSRSDADHLALAATPAIVLFSRWIRPWYSGSGALLGLVSAACIGGAVAGFAQEAGQDRQQEVELMRAIDVVAATTTREEPIFVGLTAHRYTFANPLMVYYMADRRPGTAWTMFNPGVTNTDAVQRRMIEELEASDTNVFVLDRTLAEYRELDNDSSIPGSDALDHYIATRFHVLCDFGAVRVAVRNDVAALDRECPAPKGSR